MLNIAASSDAAWHSRDFEAQMLVDLLRLSRLTVMYGAEGVGKTTLLKTGVLPLLRPRGDDHFGQDSATGAPLSASYAGEEMADHGVDIAIIFDRWDDAPLTALRMQIMDTLRNGSAGPGAPLSDLGAGLAALNRKFGVHFFIILDCFEQYLRAPRDRADIAEFDDEFVRAINAPGLGTHFLLSVRDDAEALLSRFREQISGFGDAFLRLPSFHRATAPSVPCGHTLRAAVEATTPVVNHEDLSTGSILPAPADISTDDPITAHVVFSAGSETPLNASTPIGTRLHEPATNVIAGSNVLREQTCDEVLEGFPDIAVAPASPAEAVLKAYVPQSAGAGQAIEDKGESKLKAMSRLQVRGKVQPTIHERLQLYKNSRGFLSMPKARGGATGARVHRPRKRTVLRRSVRRFAPIASLAISAGLVIGIGVGYFMVQSTPAPQSGSNLQSAAPLTVYRAEAAPVPVVAAVPPEPVVPVIAAAPSEPLVPASVPVVAATPSEPVVPVIAATPSEPPVPATPSKRLVSSVPAKKVASTQRSVSPPSATTANKAEVIAPAAQMPATVPPPREAAIVLAAAGDWQTEMRRELEACRQERFLARVACTENVRWKHCAPNRWNSVSECLTGNVRSNFP